MKHRKQVLGLLLASAALLAGCGSQGQEQSQSQEKSSQASSQSQKKKSTSSRASSKSAASSAASSGKSASSRASSKSASSSTASRMSSLTAQLRTQLPGMLLPTVDGLGQGSENLNARWTSSASQNVVYYSVGNSPLPLNASQVAKEKPYVVLTENKNVTDASSLINYQEPKSGLPTVKLDGQVTGTEEGAAGSTYLQFNQGQWSFVVRASQVQGQEALPTAKALLKLYRQYGLPASDSNASVQVDVGESLGSLNTVITWSKGSSVYQMKAHSTETAFKMLKSLQ
ncbi:hypothetical protein OCH80_04045 [Lactobacillus sp. 23-2]|uniref:hypothetical protein n=1 Tax=Lactobacillus sp. 23-2 TaxID=2981842 RepID=UPI003836B47C